MCKSVFEHMVFVHANIKKGHFRTFHRPFPGASLGRVLLNAKQVNIQNPGHSRIYHEFGLKVLSSNSANSIFVEKSLVFGSLTYYFLRCRRSTGHILHILSSHAD